MIALLNYMCWIYIIFGLFLAGKLVYDLWTGNYSKELLWSIEYHMGIHNEVALKIGLTVILLVMSIVLPILFIFDNSK